MNHFRAVCRSMGHKAVHKVAELEEHTEEGELIDTMNIDFINSNAKSPGIIEKLKTSSY